MVPVTKTDEGPAYINEYFAAHPEMMLGQPTLEHGQYGREFAIVGPFETSSLRRAIDRLPFDVYQPRSATSPKVISIPEACEGVKDGAYVEHDGRLYVRQGDTFEPANVNAATAARIRGLMTLRDAVREVLRTQIADLAESVILAARESLNDIYNAFRHGLRSGLEPRNQRAYEGDPNQPLLLPSKRTTRRRRRPQSRHLYPADSDRYRPVNHADGAAKALSFA